MRQKANSILPKTIIMDFVCVPWLSHIDQTRDFMKKKTLRFHMFCICFGLFPVYLVHIPILSHLCLPQNVFFHTTEITQFDGTQLYRGGYEYSGQHLSKWTTKYYTSRWDIWYLFGHHPMSAVCCCSYIFLLVQKTDDFKCICVHIVSGIMQKDVQLIG